jgi:hypothetical protein
VEELLVVTLLWQVGDVFNEVNLDVEVLQLGLLLDVLLDSLLQTNLVVQTRGLNDESLLVLRRVASRLDIYLVEVSFDGRVRRRLG